jgi:hypothetical protein
VGAKHRVVFGTRWAIEQVLTACGWTINTAFVERLNRDLRQRVAALRRRSATSWKGTDGLSQPLVLFQVYHNFVLPHASLRQALAEAVPPHGHGSAKVWRPWTPAMAAGVTDHVWSLREVVCYRVPPRPQPEMVSTMGSVDDRSTAWQRYGPRQGKRTGAGLENRLRERMTGCVLSLSRLGSGLETLSAASRYATHGVDIYLTNGKS